jgi:cysteine synthase A
MTRNIELALLTLDDAFRYVVFSHLPASKMCRRISDAEAVAMARYLVKNDGLFLGSSSACNLVACVKLAKQMGWSENKTIVTIL